MFWEQGVPGSNPGIPTKWKIKIHQKPVNQMIYRLFYFYDVKINHFKPL